MSYILKKKILCIGKIYNKQERIVNLYEFSNIYVKFCMGNSEK